MSEVSERAPFQTLADRLAGKAYEPILADGVPEHLDAALRAWIRDMVRYTSSNRHHYRHQLARKVALSLKLPAVRLSYHERLDRDAGSDDPSYVDALYFARSDHLIEVANAILYFGSLSRPTVGELEEILAHGGSAYRVNDGGDQLISRVTEAAERSLREVVQTGDQEAAGYIRNAWQAAYGMNPEPTAAYGDAVRAVEAVLRPVVSPLNGEATLGTIIRDLRSQSGWELVLVTKDGNPNEIGPFVDLLQQLWVGQRSRHGGGDSSRDQSQDEAEAAVQLSTFVIQWTKQGALRKNRL